MVIKQTAYIEKDENGKFKSTVSLRTILDELSEGRYLVEVSLAKKKRSAKQNAFYFGNFMQSQIDCFKERWGYSYNKDQIHSWNKANFWAEEYLNEETGEIIKLPTSSTEQTTVQWEEKMEVIRSWFLEKLDWPLPYPEQQYEIFNQ